MYFLGSKESIIINSMDTTRDVGLQWNLLGNGRPLAHLTTRCVMPKPRLPPDLHVDYQVECA